MVDRSAEAKNYARRRRQLLLADLVLAAGLMSFFLFSGLARGLEGWVVSHLPFAWPIQVGAYTGIAWLATASVNLPMDWLNSFVLEHQFNLSTQNLRQWLWEYAKKLTLSGVIGLFLVEILSFTLRISGNSWWLWAALFTIGWSALLARVLPTLLIPIFYRQKPLADEPLGQRLAQFVRNCGTRVEGIYEVNLSKTTKKANACLCGMGKTRRVLISDTLLAGYPIEEVEVVLAHEVGHHRLHHITILLAVSAAAAALSFFAVDRGARLFFGLLGIGSLSSLTALPLIGFGLFIANLFLMPATNGLSRRLEDQADRFALRQTRNPQAFISTMKHLADQNLSEMQPPRWVEWLFYDHPPIAKRIAVAQQFPLS